MTQQTQVKQLPKGWKESPISEIGEIITGNTPSKKIKEYYENGTIEFIKPTDLQNRDITTFTEKISDSAKKVARTIKQGGVLVTCIGEIGRTGFVKKEVAFNQQINGIQPNDELYGKFLFYRIQMEKKQIGDMASATTISIVNKSKFEKTKITYPESLSEQTIIASEIDKQFSRLEEIVKVLKSIKNKLQVYKKSVLKKAFEGDSWEYSKIGKIFKTSSGGTPSRANKAFYTGNIPWLKSGELMDKTNIEESEEHISQEALEKSSAKIFPIDTTLIAMYGATTGKIGIIKKECSTNQAICGIFPNQDSLSKFIFYFLLFKREIIINQSKGGAQPNISQEIIKNLDFPLLSKDIQKKIIQEIESKFSLIDKIEDTVIQSLLKSEKLRKSILKTAFEGKLVKMEEVKQ